MKPLILVTAPVQTRSGYGNHARDICRALIESDKYEIRIQSVRWGNTPPNALEEGNPHHEEIAKRILRRPSLERQPDLHIHIVIPNEFQPIAKKNIGMTAGIEHTIPPAEWVDGCNRMDKVIFTSNFSQEGFANVSFDKLDNNTKQKVGELKLEKPSDVLFEGADTEIYKETNKISDMMNEKFSKINNDFCFLFVGHWLQGNIGEDRKDVGMMLKVFLEAFKNIKNPPALIMKTSSAGFSVMDREELKKKVNMIKKDVKANTLPDVYLLHGDLTDDEMNEMYNHPKVKAHLTFTHGEGFGRPLLEASFSGKPIIAPISTGQADFLSKDYTIQLPHEMVKVPNNALPKQYMNSEAMWSSVNYGVALNIIKQVFNNYEKFKIRGKKQMIVNRQEFSFEAMKDKLIGMVDEVMSDIPQEVKIKLPNLKSTDSKKLKLPTLKKG
jgi:glycosyltransferase involved in cell wall biosynthesis